MKVLISAYTGLGNFILKTPMIKLLSKLYPNCRIDLLCGSDWGVEKVLENTELINHVHWFPLDSKFTQKTKYLKKLKKENYNLILLPFDSTPFYLLLGANYILKKSKIIAHVNIYSMGVRNLIKRLFSLSLLSNIIWVPLLHGRHEIDLNFDLVDIISYENQSFKKDKKTLVSYKPNDNIISLNKKYIVIQPFARNGILSPKTWSISSYYEFTKKWLQDNSKYSVVLVGDQKEINNFTNSQLNKLEGTINLIGKTNFSQLCNVIRNASAVVANDSGIMHVADAIGVPLVALYGPTDITRTKPLSITSKILCSKNSSFCNMYAFKYGEDDTLKKFGDNYCMKDISVKSVLLALDQIIRNKN